MLEQLMITLEAFFPGEQLILSALMIKAEPPWYPPIQAVRAFYSTS